MGVMALAEVFFLSQFCKSSTLTVWERAQHNQPQLVGTKSSLSWVTGKMLYQFSKQGNFAIIQRTVDNFLFAQINGTIGKFKVNAQQVFFETSKRKSEHPNYVQRRAKAIKYNSSMIPAMKPCQTQNCSK